MGVPPMHRRDADATHMAETAMPRMPNVSRTLQYVITRCSLDSRFTQAIISRSVSPMKRTRQVLVMTLVATALCADRVTAAPDLRAQLQSSADPIARLAKHLATRLSVKFQRVVPSVGLHQPRPQDPAPTPPQAPR